MRILILVSALALSGCAGTHAHREMLMNQGAIALRSSERPGVDYVVSIRNVVDIGYNSDNPQTRKETAVALAEPQCPGARVVGEKPIRTGEYLGGRPSYTYELDIKCR